MIVINPGSGPVDGATLENAEANIGVFVDDLRERGVFVSAFAWGESVTDGRFRFELFMPGRTVEVDMPGLPLGQVRYMGESDQNIWHFPRLYVDGSSWVWVYALGAAESDGEDDE